MDHTEGSKFAKTLRSDSFMKLCHNEKWENFKKSLLKEIGFRAKPIFRFKEPVPTSSWQVLVYICLLEAQVANFSIDRTIEELKKINLPLPLKVTLTKKF